MLDALAVCLGIFLVVLIGFITGFFILIVLVISGIVGLLALLIKGIFRL